MKKRLTAITALLIVFSFLFTSISVSAVFVTGDTVVGVKITESEVHEIGEGLVFNEYTYTDPKGNIQTCFTAEYNPATTDYLTMVYHKRASYSNTITDDAEAAQKEGFQVYAAINGDFFSTESINSGTANGIYVTNGKIKSSNCWGSDWVLAVSPDGSVHVVESWLYFDLYINGTNYRNPFRYINKRLGSSDLSTEEPRIYYYDKDIGATNPLKECDEIVCTYKSGELTPGGSLKATIKEIRSTGGSALSGNDFVLACRNFDLSSIKVGDEVEITSKETRGNKEIVENAVSLINAKYVLVHEGVDRWKGGNGEIAHDGRSDQFAQRSVVGLKPDGSVVFMACDGRKARGEGVNGFDFTMIVDMMLALGCTEVVNFDGGGSTSFVISEGDGKFNYEFIGESTGRNVANSILIVRDPNAASLPEPTYAPIVDDPDTELRNVAVNKKYIAQWEGINEPIYLNNLTGDRYFNKLTNGKYRPIVNENNVSVAYRGTGANVSFVVDLEQVRNDIRDVTFKGLTIGSDRGFKKDNVIVYVSDDSIHWSKSIGIDLIVTNMAENVYDICAKFKEAKSGRYVKMIIGTDNYVLELDELQIHAMVSKGEPVEYAIDDPNAPKPAENPPSDALNIALGKNYTIYANGSLVTSYYNTCIERDPPVLTDDQLGASGNWTDGRTLGFIAGSGKQVDIVFDFGKEMKGIEFVQVLNMITNGSFGAAMNGTASYSSNGTDYTDALVNLATESVVGTSYNHLTMQLRQKINARYFKVSVFAPKYLFGMGEVKVFATEKQIPDIQKGDVDGNGNVDATDYILVKRHILKIKTLEGDSFWAADMDENSALDATDYINIKRIILGLK